MLTIAATFATNMNRVVGFVDLSVATFDLSKANPTRFRSRHVLAVAARDVHIKARAVPIGLSLACEGAYLSACAQFEQCVRDLIEETAIQVAAKMSTFANLPSKMQDVHIHFCGNILQNLTQDKFRHLTATGIVAALHGCVVTPAVPVSLVLEAFSSNEKNFKPHIVSEHVKRLGLKEVWKLLSQQSSLQTHFGTTSPADTERFSKERLERIMDKRNTIIHRGKAFVAPSDLETRECATFFTSLAEALAHVLVDYVATL